MPAVIVAVTTVKVTTLAVADAWLAPRVTMVAVALIKGAVETPRIVPSASFAVEVPSRTFNEEPSEPVTEDSLLLYILRRLIFVALTSSE